MGLQHNPKSVGVPASTLLSAILRPRTPQLFFSPPVKHCAGWPSSRLAPDWGRNWGWQLTGKSAIFGQLAAEAAQKANNHATTCGDRMSRKPVIAFDAGSLDTTPHRKRASGPANGRHAAFHTQGPTMLLLGRSAQHRSYVDQP